MPTKAWPGQSEHCMLGSPLLKSKTDRLTDVSQPYSTPNELGMPLKDFRGGHASTMQRCSKRGTFLSAATNVISGSIGNSVVPSSAG